MSQAKDKTIISVKELLSLESLEIPAYQRPYKWTLKNVTELLQDICAHQDKKAYRLGTIVFHQELAQVRNQLNIVDGQQRTLTLVLTVWAIITSGRAFERQDIKNALQGLKPLIERFMSQQKFSSDISQLNLHQNYLELLRLVSRSDFSEDHIDFLLNRCEVVIFVLEDVSEAFQFFDSQNARGRDLEPHDLLKAFHLREFAEHESDLKAFSVAHWESLPSNELASLFAAYLYRVRQWAKGKSARYFEKNQVDLFKGVNLDKIGHFPYTESLRITHHFVDNYNSQYQRKIDGSKMSFPFHLDQMIINGRRFFELAEHYQQQVAEIVAYERKFSSDAHRLIIAGIEVSETASKIIKTLSTYKNRTRTGDKYVRVLFDCAVIFYIDKFGGEALSIAIEKIFIWAYRCRIKQEVVQLATMDNYVLSNNLFIKIKEATDPNDVLSIPLQSINKSENKNNSSKSPETQDELVKLFKEMHYYE